MLYKKINYEYIFPSYFDAQAYERRKDFMKSDIIKHLLVKAYNVIEHESTDELNLFIGKVIFEVFDTKKIKAYIEIVKWE